jgi:hypothetical protein
VRWWRGVRVVGDGCVVVEGCEGCGGRERRQQGTRGGDVGVSEPTGQLKSQHDAHSEPFQQARPSLELRSRL